MRGGPTALVLFATAVAMGACAQIPAAALLSELPITAGTQTRMLHAADGEARWRPSCSRRAATGARPTAVVGQQRMRPRWTTSERRVVVPLLQQLPTGSRR